MSRKTRTLFCLIGVLIYFDLNSPQDLLKEQDLWKEVPKALPDNMPVDKGMPKTNAKFLVAGSCFAPRGPKSKRGWFGFK